MSIRYSCLFGGGAIRGVSYIGAIRALEELNIDADTLAGSSVGSVFAALIAIGYTSDELKEIFAQVNFNLFKDISIGLGPLFAVSKGEVFLEWVRELIERKVYGSEYKKGFNPAVTFKDIKKTLVVITTDLTNFKSKEFSKFETPDYEIASAIRISCCMPGLMKPIEYNNRLLVDGDLQKSLPMWKLSNTLNSTSDRILELRLEGDYENSDISGLDYANAVYSCMTATSTEFIKSLYGDNDKYDYIVLNTGDIVIVDFNLNEGKRNELIQSGYEQTMSYFKKFLPVKKAKIKACFEKILNSLLTIEKLIKLNKIHKAKTFLGNLFIDLSDCNKILDECDIKSIRAFKDCFLDNIKYPALFGKIKLANNDEVLDNLLVLKNNVENKLKELNEYLKLYN